MGAYMSHIKTCYFNIYGCLNFMCETYMLTYMDHILKALYCGIYDKRHNGYIYVFFIYVP